MITLDALQPRLRHLKLSGMRDAIGPRAEEARARGLDPLEFLALLLDDELARREADGLDRRIRKARFDEQLCGTTACAYRPRGPFPEVVSGTLP